MIDYAGLPDRVYAQLLKDVGVHVTNILETTREDIQREVKNGLDEGLSAAELGDRIEDATTFSELRAETIARTETATLLNQAAVASYREFGVTHVTVIDGDDDEECAEANGQVWTLEEAEANPIAHPNCIRDFAPFIGTPEEEAEEPESSPDSAVGVDGKEWSGRDLGPADREEHQEWFRETYGQDYIDQLAEADYRTPELVESYTKEGYAPLNSYLRGDYNPPRLSDLTPLERVTMKPLEGPDLSSLENQVKILDDAAAVRPLPEDMTMYRSLSVDWDREESPINALFGTGNLDEMIGRSGVEPGFLSVSTRGDITKDIAGEYLLELQVPKGSPAIGAQTMSAKPSEMEVILGRNARITVIGTDTQDGVSVVRAAVSYD